MKTLVKQRCDKEYQYFLEHASKIDAIYLGDEFCSVKLFSDHKLVEKVRKARELGKEVFVAIPIIQQSHLEEMKQLINDLIELDTEVILVINDLGTVYYIGQLEKENKLKLKLYLGRLLNKNIESCPWYEHTIRDESEFIKDAMLANGFDSKVVMDYFFNLGVRGIESNTTPKQADSLREIKACGFEIALNYDYTYVTSGRVCATAYYCKQKVGECSGICNQGFDVELSKVKDVFSITESFKESDEVKDVYGKMRVFGNAVYKELPECELDKQVADYIIFDMKKYGPDYDGLMDAIEKVR